jgi:hypothetical protein
MYIELMMRGAKKISSKFNVRLKNIITIKGVIPLLTLLKHVAELDLLRIHWPKFLAILQTDSLIYTRQLQKVMCVWEIASALSFKIGMTQTLQRLVVTP